MSVDYTLALSRTQFDAEEAKYIATIPTNKCRDEVVNLCSVGDCNFDLAKILHAFEWEKMDEDFIGKIERVLNAVGTCEQYEIDSVLKWMRANIGEKYILVAE